MSIIRLIVFCFVAVIAAFFAVSNRELTAVTYLPGKTIDIALFILVLGTFAVGVFVGLVLTVVPMTGKVLREKRAKRKTQKQLKVTEKKLDRTEKTVAATTEIRNTTVKPTTNEHTKGDIPVTQEPKPL